jgi:hypothetical protein
MGFEDVELIVLFPFKRVPVRNYFEAKKKHIEWKKQF